MKILLISVTPVRSGCEALRINGNYVGAGWIEGLADSISTSCDLHLLFFSSVISKVIQIKKENIIYIAIPTTDKSFENMGNDSKIAIYLKNIKNQINPDIVQMFGTETKITNLVLNVFGNERTIVHLTGLVGPYSLHFFGGLSDKEIRVNTFRDFIKGGIKHDKNNFVKNAAIERKSIKDCKYVIGRTTWDKAAAQQINPEVKYYHCNEILRHSFYIKRWDYNCCRKHSIFVSSSASPLKGFHNVLEALPLVLKKFPDTILVVTGRDVTKTGTFVEYLRQTTYGKLLAERINKYGIINHVRFLGSLNENDMVEQYLNANVYVLPSNIENSPNSLGEAMMLGVPCVAAYVGGVPDMLKHESEGMLYPFDEPYMLSYYICQLFEDSAWAKKLGDKARERALKTHNRDEIVRTMLSIYEDVRKTND